MTGIDRAKKCHRFAATDFAQNNTIRAHPQRCDQQIFGRYLRLAKRTARGDQPDCILVRNLQFGCVFDQDQSFLKRDFL